MKRILFILFMAVILGLTISFSLYAQHEGHKPRGNGLASDSQSHQPIYYCPMHPSYTSDRPGDCPICNMTLVKKEESGAIEEKVKITEGGKQAFYISPDKQQLIGVKTDKAIKRPLTKVIRTVGRVAFDPQLYKSQQEYIEAIKTLEKVKGSGQEEVVRRAQALVDASALKLTLSGLSKEQIEELALKKENDSTLLISSPDSAMWVYATIYEYELESVKVGEEVTITSVSAPGKEFRGKIVAEDPVLDEMTRSVRARIKVDNPEGSLKPNMYVDVKIEVDMGVHLVLPKEAIMDTGTRKIVFIALPEGYFQSREIKTGFSTDDYAQVIEGVNEGEDVVVSGNFLIDSESKLKAALEGTGHQHGQE